MPRDDPPTTPHPSRRALGPPQDEETARPIKSQEARRTEGPTGKPLRPRHEAFCQHFDLLGNAADAAGKDGYALEWRRNQGYRLARQPRIQARVAEIRSGLARVHCLDADMLLGKLEAVYQCAIDKQSLHTAARCVEIQARISGLGGGKGREEEKPQSAQRSQRKSGEGKF